MKKKTGIFWGVVLLVAAAAIVWIVRANRPEPVFTTTVVRPGTVEITVMATGYIQPVEEVEVGTQVSGVIEKIYVDYNSVVTAGQLLAELDRSTLEERLVQAKASLSRAQSDLLLAEQNHTRVKQLHDAKAATDVALEEAVNRLTQAQTALEDAQANTNQAQVNRDFAFIYSPINGVVLDRQVNVGQTVASSFSTPTLFTIAEDLTEMQVEVDVDEADIGQVRVGQNAVFTVDAYGDEYFEGTVQQVRLQPIVTNNVVTYTVIVEAPNPEKKLFPGMTANINIQAESESGLVIPLSALSFRLTPEIAHLIQDSEPGSLPPPPAARPQNGGQRPNGTNGQTEQSVWVKKNGGLEMRTIQTGLSDGINTVAVSGLQEGDEVILSAVVGKKKDAAAAARNPLMPTRRR